jgi:ATP-dependent RNA/DNA helicase IGHMBP2
VLGFGFNADGQFHHDRTPATRDGTMRRLRAEMDAVKKDAKRTTLRVNEIRVGTSFFRASELMRRDPEWLKAGMRTMQIVCEHVSGEPVPLAPTRMSLMPNQRTGADPVGVSVRMQTDGRITIQVRDIPENPVAFVRALDDLVDITDTESIHFLEQRMAVLRALRGERAASRLEKPATLPKPGRQPKSALDLLKMPDESISVIVGPPGTGKTQTISDLALKLQSEGKSCLLLSWTRIAVDEALERVVARGGRAFRLGRNDSSDIPNAPWDDDVDWKDVMSGEIGLPLFGDRTGKPALLGGTFLQTFCRYNAEYTNDDGAKFDVVLVDEASQAPFEAVLFAMHAGNKTILLGDPIQLPPVFRADRLDKTTAKEAEDCLSTILAHRPDLFVLLDTQYRSMPGIMDWSSESFYGGMLKNGRPEDDKYLRWPRALLPRIHLEIVPEAGESNRYNPHTIKRAQSVFRSASKQLVELGLPLRGLYITPYKEQATKAEDAFNTIAMDLTVGTVDASQGKQAPIVVFDLCTAKETIFWQTPTMARRFNVALTRATHHLVVIVPEGLLRTAKIGWLRSLFAAIQAP